MIYPNNLIDTHSLAIHDVLVFITVFWLSVYWCPPLSYYLVFAREGSICTNKAVKLFPCFSLSQSSSKIPVPERISLGFKISHNATRLDDVNGSLVMIWSWSNRYVELKWKESSKTMWFAWQTMTLFPFLFLRTYNTALLLCIGDLKRR